MVHCNNVRAPSWVTAKYVAGKTQTRTTRVWINLLTINVNCVEAAVALFTLKKILHCGARRYVGAALFFLPDS
jgi:hypothetical protein